MSMPFYFFQNDAEYYYLLRMPFCISACNVNPLNAGYFSKNRLYCRLLNKTFKLCLFFMGSDGLSSKQIGSQARCRVTRRLAWIQPVCISLNAVPALKGLRPCYIQTLFDISVKVLRHSEYVDPIAFSLLIGTLIFCFLLNYSKCL